MRRIKLILAVLFMALASAPLGAEELDMNEYLFGHVGDSYEWHITTVKGHPVSIPLPVIVRSKTSGWHVFSSRHLEEGIHEGFYISSSAAPPVRRYGRSTSPSPRMWQG